MLNQPSLEQHLQRWTQFIQLDPTQPKAYVQRGMVRFKLAQIDESIQDFDQAEILDPAIAPYLWQRGLSYYYAEQFEAGANQFEIDLTVNAQDVEETVWRYLCMARIKGTENARTALLPVKNDPRRLLRSVYDLFAGACSPEEVLAIGVQEGHRGLFYSHLYVGLFYEANGDEARSRHHITTAATHYPLEDYMWHLACVHQYLRSWTT